MGYSLSPLTGSNCIKLFKNGCINWILFSFCCHVCVSWVYIVALILTCSYEKRTVYHLLFTFIFSTEIKQSIIACCLVIYIMRLYHQFETPTYTTKPMTHKTCTNSLEFLMNIWDSNFPPNSAGSGQNLNTSLRYMNHIFQTYYVYILANQTSSYHKIENNNYIISR